METLLEAAEQAVPFLRERLGPARPVDPRRIARLIADLDSEECSVRERATEELARLGESAGPVLREACARTRSPEVRRRLEQLLERLEAAALPPESLRGIRSVEVLEQ